ncbi:DNA-binding response regulator [Vallitalea longa]|uniref:Stage 0 sporulation protein A homolog n=1 Tax=Vallitalea longa TaxID=2936439 RepID=A0A9W5Y7L8_9FIRM|nr:response regulator [Vallitalea longa]GKX27674.1 DNA-binding response regulator [Vallitalea longa]
MRDKKLRVLIVDDEFRIGMLVKKLIKWDEIGLECVDVVDKGQTAYDLILTEHPDIVITDIRMPRVSGLDLIRMTKGQAKFIVISGYREFEYAHKALQYGVNDYLLKPINDKELNKVLKKIKEEIIKACIKQKKEEQLKKTITVSEHIIKSNILNNIIEHEDNLSEIEMKEDYNLMINAAAYRGIDIKLDYRDYEKIDKRQDRLTVEKVISIVEENLNEKVNEQLICEKDNLNLYCLINYELKDSKDIKNAINFILTKIQEYLLGFEQYEVTIGIGSEGKNFDKIRFSIQESFKAVQNRIKLGTGRLIYVESVCLENQFDVHKYLDKKKELFLMSIESLSKVSLEQSINQIYSEFQFQDNIDFSCCYDITNELINMFFNHITIKNKEGEQLKQWLLNVYQQCYTLSKLKRLLKKYLGEYLEKCLRILEVKLSKPIRQAKQYIDEHYNEKIILDDIADIVDLNPVYFSVLFKKETGLNFSSYLVNVRMEIAKEMIRNSNKTISAVADGVGYKDARYFSQIFTKIVGIKPALYRKLYS